MTKDNVIEITRRDVLISEKNKCVKTVTKLEIDIATLERSDSNLVVAREKLTEKSYREITVKEMLEQYRNDLKGTQVRLETIEQLLNG